MTQDELNPIEELCNAIIIQAVKDYREALKGVTVGRQPRTKTIHELERFFRSKWFTCLTTLDGERLMERLREEVKGSKK
jgi:hypothetical protein